MMDLSATDAVSIHLSNFTASTSASLKKGSDSRVTPLHHVGSDASSTETRPRPTYWPTYRFFPLKSKAAVLVLVSNFLVFGAARGGVSICLERILPVPDTFVWKQAAVNVGASTILVLYPLFGWVADTWLGKYRTTLYSLWWLWVASIVLTCVALAHYVYWEGDANSRTDYYASKVMFSILFVAFACGKAGYDSNIVPFGVEQMPGASSEELSQFVSWYFWSGFVGIGLVNTFFLSCQDGAAEIRVVQALVQTACLSAAICIDFLFQRRLTKEKARGSPLRTIVGILNYARKAKFKLGNRSALTMWEDRIPSRIDQAKRRYGGPFHDESVEDVKSVCHIGILLFSLVPSMVAFIPVVVSTISHFDNAFVDFDNDGDNTISLCLSTAIVGNFNGITCIIFVPFYLFVIQPIFRNYIPRTIVRITVGVCITAVSIVAFLVMHSVAPFINSDNVYCFLDANTDSEQLTVDYHWAIIPYSLAGLGWLMVTASMLEFVCAQAPYQMRGFLNGVNYCVIGMGYVGGMLVMAVFYWVFKDRSSTTPSCGFWYYFFNLFLVVLGVGLFGYTAEKYTPRQRNELSFRQTNIERHFDQVNFID